MPDKFDRIGSCQGPTAADVLNNAIDSVVTPISPYEGVVDVLQNIDPSKQAKVQLPVLVPCRNGVAVQVSRRPLSPKQEYRRLKQECPNTPSGHTRRSMNLYINATEKSPRKSKNSPKKGPDGTLPPVGSDQQPNGKMRRQGTKEGPPRVVRKKQKDKKPGIPSQSKAVVERKLCERCDVNVNWELLGIKPRSIPPCTCPPSLDGPVGEKIDKS